MIGCPNPQTFSWRFSDEYYGPSSFEILRSIPQTYLTLCLFYDGPAISCFWARSLLKIPIWNHGTGYRRDYYKPSRRKPRSARLGFPITTAMPNSLSLPAATFSLDVAPRGVALTRRASILRHYSLSRCYHETERKCNMLPDAS